MEDRKLAAVFIDLENFYYSLTNTFNMSYDEASTACVSIVGNALEKLSEKNCEVIIRQAFADWSNLSEVKKELQKMGVRIIDVLSTEYKNSADIELSLAVQEVVLTRPDINVIMILAGDRDYMPVALRAMERGRTLYFVGFKETLSGDIKKLVGQGYYFYAEPRSYKIYEERESVRKTSGEEGGVEELTAEELKAAEAALRAYDEYKDKFGSVKLGAFLVDRLAKALPELSHLQRKQVFQSLVEKGVLETQLRETVVPGGMGDTEKFAVFVVREDSNIVKMLRKKIGE